MNTETVWSNIRHLTKILFKQYRSLIIAFFVIAILSPLWNVWISLSSMKGSSEAWSINDLDSSAFEILLLGLILAFCNYNILSKNEISMYPGTVISRYYSSILGYHIIIILLVLASIWNYLIQGVMLLVMHHIYGGIIPEKIFSLNYLCHGAVRYLGHLLAIYGISILWFTLLERFRPVVIYCITLLVAGLGISLFYTGYITTAVQTVINLYTGKQLSFWGLMALLLITWAVCLLLSWCLVRSMRAWKPADRKRIVISLAMLYGLFLFLFFGLEAEIKEEGRSNTLDFAKFNQITDHQMETVVDVSALSDRERSCLDSYFMLWTCEKSTEVFDYSERNMRFACSAKLAKKYGLDFDESKLDQNHIILLLGTRGLLYDGKDLGEEILKACKDSVVLVKNQYDEVYQKENPDEEYDAEYYYQVELPEKQMIVLNEAYGDLRQYLKNTTLRQNDNAYFGASVAESLLGIVIYPDEWQIDFDEDTSLLENDV